VADKNFDNPNWKPLEKVIGSGGCEDFMWMWREGEIEFYKHISTRRYLLLDSEGQCYRCGPRGLELANIKSELERVMERSA
jgi:hypothetical protein